VYHFPRSWGADWLCSDTASPNEQEKVSRLALRVPLQLVKHTKDEGNIPGQCWREEQLVEKAPCRGINMDKNNRSASDEDARPLVPFTLHSCVLEKLSQSEEQKRQRHWSWDLCYEFRRLSAIDALSIWFFPWETYLPLSVGHFCRSLGEQFIQGYVPNGQKDPVKRQPLRVKREVAIEGLRLDGHVAILHPYMSRTRRKACSIYVN
jgi:hypothetical protein